jgi:hypothetical protein
MRETKNVQIGDCTYKITQLGAYQSLTVLHILLRTVAPAFKAATVADENAALDMLGERLGGIMERLSEADMRKIMDTFAGVTVVNIAGVPQELTNIFDGHFTGKRLADMVFWAKECLWFNFADFLVGLQGRAGLLAGNQKEEEPNLPTG